MLPSALVVTSLTRPSMLASVPAVIPGPYPRISRASTEPSLLQESAHLHRRAHLQRGSYSRQCADFHRDTVDQQTAVDFHLLNAAFDVHRIGACFPGFAGIYRARAD